jgi:hypothetical protein
VRPVKLMIHVESAHCRCCRGRKMNTTA